MSNDQLAQDHQNHDPSANLSRRTLLRGAAATGAAVVGFGAIDGLVRAGYASAHPRHGGRGGHHGGRGGYGELVQVTREDPVTGFAQELMLPEGFDFAIFGLAGTTMDDGHVTPLGHDGMAAFRGPRGSYRLVRNHEERTESGSVTPSGDPEDRYDDLGGGGTTTLDVRLHRDGRRRWGRGRHEWEPKLDRVWTSLAGTIVNCAGGPTPWGSWLTCEETTAGIDAGWQQRHGYVFEVDAGSYRPSSPKPLPALGRFVHEAVAVDPATNIVYLTEDQGTAGFYRFVPHHRHHRNLTDGKLQMLKVADVDGYDTRTGQEQGRRLPAEWVDIDDPDPADAESNALAVYQQGAAQGGAVFARLEGCWYGDGAVYLVCTSGGDLGEGQIWEYRPSRSRHHRGDGTLSLVYESFDRAVLSFPDNITVSPRGALLACEDTSRGNPQMVGITRHGEAFPLAVNPLDDEWCGATFSHDGRILFANMQGSTRGDPSSPELPGRTVAIWGPWHRGAL